MGANQNAQKLLCTGLVNTKDCYSEAYNLDSAVFLSNDSAIAHKETLKIFLHSVSAQFLTKHISICDGKQ